MFTQGKYVTGAMRAQRYLTVFRSLGVGYLLAGLAFLSPIASGRGLVVGQDVQSAGDALLQRAREELHREEFPTAERTLRTYLQHEPGSADGLYLLGEVLMRKDEPKESLSVFTEAAAARRPTGEELRLVGLDYVLLADYADAVESVMTPEMAPWLDCAAI